MTNERMAMELAHLNRMPDEEDRYYLPIQCKIFDAVIKTAEWKDEEGVKIADNAMKKFAKDVLEKIQDGWTLQQINEYMTFVLNF